MDYGYWWGNGHTDASGGVILSVPNSKPELIEQIENYANSHTKSGCSTRQKEGCVQIRWHDSMLVEALKTFKQEGWSQKTPPQWVEYAPLDWQRALVRGYYDADGNTNTREGASYQA